MRLVREEPRLLAFLLIVTAVGFASDPVNTEAPAFAHAFGRPDTDAGYLIGAFGIGAVSAAFLLAGRVAGSRRRMFATLVLLGAGVIGFSLSPWLPVAYVFLALAGFGYLASNTSATSRLQLDVAEHQRGRIMALWSVAFLGLRPIASLTDGAIAGGVRRAPRGRSCSRSPRSRARARSTSYSVITDRLRIGRSFPSMELHFIADDLEEHAWYVDLVADFVEDVETFLAQLEEAI